ncbi:MAG: hypothetical protein PHV37_08295 [Candidatus Gastranaerophilales bacterium]|nr:hypothetical protein [Candidatus Gastranaerophilales bacterium]
MDYKQITLLYEKIYNTSVQVKTCLEEEDFDTLENIIEIRNGLYSQLDKIAGLYKDLDSYPSDLKNLIEKIKILEKTNLDNLTKMHAETKQKLSNENKKDKILNTYQPQANKSRIVDIRE